MTVLDILSAAGTASSGLIYTSLIPDLYYVHKTRDTSHMNFYPLLAMLIQSYVWILYSFANNMVYPLGTINMYGAFMGSVYLCIYYKYDRLQRRKHQRLIVSSLASMLALSTFYLFPFVDLANMQIILGILADMTTLALFMSPLSELQQVIQQRCSDIIPFGMVFSGFLDCSIWTLISILKADLFLFLQAAIPGLLCMIQLAFIAIYPRTQPVFDKTVLPLLHRNSETAYTYDSDPEYSDEA